MDDISALCLTACCMSALLLRDYMFLFVWVAYLLLTSNPLVLVISFFSTLTFASVRPCMCLFL